MIIVVFGVFLLLSLAAMAFVAVPALRGTTGPARPRTLLAVAVSLFVLGIGVGSYLIIGTPELALRSFEGANARDLNGLIALLAQRVRTAPYDVQGWTMLGRAYLTAGDAPDAAKAFQRGIETANAHGAAGPSLLSAYGEALVQGASGTVTPEAEAAFNAALAENPKETASRFYLGLAYSARGENARALTIWQSLLADTPQDAPWRGALIDQIAAVSARAGQSPDIGAMVQGLADRLKAHPDDAQGWQRLVRAYSVMGQDQKAKTALADARSALRAKPDALKALDAEAAQLNLK